MSQHASQARQGRALQPRTDLAILLIAAIIVVIFLFPYWVFGDLSMGGWYDEFDAYIPWQYLKVHLGLRKGFLHSYAGGAGALSGCFFGGEAISLYRAVISHFSMWIGHLLIRTSLMLSLIGGIYFFLIRVVGLQSRLLALVLGFYATFVSYVPYGWSLSGQGWNQSILCGLVIIIFYEFRRRWVPLVLTLLLSVMAGSVSTPDFLMPSSFFFVSLIFLLLSKDSSLVRKKGLLALILCLIFLGLMGLGWWESFQAAILNAKEYSARIQGVLSEQRSDSLRGVLKLESEEYVAFFSHYASRYLFAGYLMMLWLAWKTDNFIKVCWVLGLSLGGPFALDAFAKLAHIPLLSQYRWTTLVLLQPLLVALCIGYLNSKRAVPTLGGQIFILIVIVLISVKILSVDALSNLNVSYGLGGLTRYTILQKLQSTRGKVRMISAGRIGVVPLFYGLDTFDGVLQNFSVRRNYFVAYGVYSPPVKVLHTHRHQFYDFPNSIDVEMLKLANVGLVASDKALPQIKGRELGSHPALFARDTSMFFKPMLAPWLGEIRLISPLHVYEWDGVWPRVFEVGDVTVSKHSYRSVDFYQDLKKINFSGALVAREDVTTALGGWGSVHEAKVKSFELSPKGAKIVTNGEQGVIGFNQVFIPSWTATCLDRELPITPMNGVMMAVVIPKGCDELVFQFTE